MSLFTQKNKNFKPLKPLSKSKIITNLILLILFLILFCYCSFSISAYHFDFSVIATYKEKFLQGFLNTLIISFFSLLLSIILGGVFCAFSLSSIVFFKIFIYILHRAYQRNPFTSAGIIDVLYHCK